MADAVLTTPKGLSFRLTLEDEDLCIRVEGPDEMSATILSMDRLAGNEGMVRARIRKPILPGPVRSYPRRST